MTDQIDVAPLDRWRLVLGEAAEGTLGGCSGEVQSMDEALQWLYGRDEGLAERDIYERHGGSGPSSLTVPDWINEVHRLFPKETVERLEKDAVERFGIDEVVTNPEVLKRVEPNQTLLKAVMRTKHLMNPEVLALARKLVEQVVRELMDKMRQEIKRSFTGSLDRRRPSPFKIARNLDFKRTLRKNLGRWSPEEHRLFVEKVYFHSRTKRHSDKWQIIILVDQSGSMLDSVIHSAVTAACLWGLPSIRTHLVVFDTSVVDLTEQCTDPVELLMKVQLGGGTDISRAVEYAAGLIDSPKQSIMVLITDFFEGGDAHQLERRVKSLCAQGTHFLGLAALDRDAAPVYDKELARRLSQVGALVGAMTPGELAAFIAQRVRL